jgi:hypothetical protein
VRIFLYDNGCRDKISCSFTYKLARKNYSIAGMALALPPNIKSFVILGLKDSADRKMFVALQVLTVLVVAVAIASWNGSRLPLICGRLPGC